ncbi:MAG: alpha-L-fucosidase [Eubacteriales bacterium]
MSMKFDPTFESLSNCTVPSWFRDVKFGIWSHWGPQSVPMYGDWCARVMIDGFRESRVAWGSSDYRFTCKGNDVYAFMMCAPADRRAVVKSFTEADHVEKVTLLGHGEVAFAQNYGVLTVALPENLPTKYTNCLKITLAS